MKILFSFLMTTMLAFSHSAPAVASASTPGFSCKAMFQSEYSEVDQANSALRALENGLSKNKSIAKQEVTQWFHQIQQRQKNGSPLSVMEHTALTFLLKKNEFNEDFELTSSMKNSLKQSWMQLSSESVSNENLLERLPNRVLKKATRDEVLFHQALFHEGPLGFLGSIKMFAKDYIFKPKDVIFTLILGSALFSQIGIEPVAAALEGYAVATFIEYLAHRYIAHASKKSLAALDSMKWLKKQVQEIAFSHSAVHHGGYGLNYVENFAPRDLSQADSRKIQQEKKAKMDALIQAQGEEAARRIYESDYGVRLSTPTADAFLSLPFSVILSLLTKYAANHIGVDLDPSYYITLLTTSALYVPASHFMHPYLHMTKKKALNQAGIFMKWFLQTRYVAWIARSHYVHHADGGNSNQNLLAGADFAFGYQPITVEQLLRLKNSGAIY